MRINTTTTLVILCLLIFPQAAPAQKKSSTLMGDGWVGVVTATDDATRQITLKTAGPDGSENFTGVLEEGAKAKVHDGSFRELKASEIPVGTRVWVLYKTKQQEIAGGKVKINRISKLYFLPKEEFDPLREQLGLPSSTPVAFVESKGLVEADPLKMFVAIDGAERTRFIKWVEEWNRGDAKKYGAIELVDSFTQGDAFVAMHGNKENPTLVTMPVLLNGTTQILSPMVSVLGVRKGGGLEVLWKQRVIVSNVKAEGQAGLLEKQVESRLKERRRIQKK